MLKLVQVVYRLGHFYLTKDFFIFVLFLFKIIDLVGVAARSRPKKCSFIEKNRFEVQLPSFDIGTKVTFFNIFFAGFLFKIIDLVGVAAISKQLLHYFIEKNWFKNEIFFKIFYFFISIFLNKIMNQLLRYCGYTY